MLECAECLKDVGQTGFRLSSGSVDYEELEDGTYQLIFVPEPFDDGDMFKYLCVHCAEWQGVYLDELDMEVCLVIEPESGDCCGLRFEPVDSEGADLVLRVEWGSFRSVRKGPFVTRHEFSPTHEARVHYGCAAEHWGLTHLCQKVGLIDDGCLATSAR